MDAVKNFYISNGEIKKTKEWTDEPNGKVIYEVIRIINGKPLFYEEHYERMKNSFKLSNVEFKITEEELKEDIDKLNQSFLDEAQFNVDKMKAKFDPNLNVTTKVLVGFPAETIVKVAEEEDVGLIAISSSGKGRVTKFFIGSVAEKVIHSFKKDVLLVH